MNGNGIIIAKSSGIDLFTHSESVKDTAFIINKKGNFNLDNNVLFHSSILHDVGKANPLYLENIEKKDYTNVMRHEISSLLFIEIVPEKIRDIVAFIILSHHKSINNDERSLFCLYNEDEDRLFKNHIGDIEVWGEKVKDYFLNHYNIKIKIPSKERCIEIIEEYVEKISQLERGYSLYRGIFMLSDHFASCYENDEERINNLNKLFNVPKLDFYFNVNEKYPLSLVQKDIIKKHTLCIAPTGCGKTNFMMRLCNGKRIFYCLPYQASINAMYQRIKNDLDENETVGLKHGSFMSLSFLDENTKILSSFHGLPVKIITPFQILSINTRMKGYESDILDLKGQSIILDEIHTYNNITLAYLFKLIEFLLTLDCTINICTATMPTYLQNKIIDLLDKNGGVQIVKLNENQLEKYNRHIIHTVENLDYNEIINRYKKGEKVLVVLNTIESAKTMYKKLKSMSDNVKIMCLHSRWKRTDRNVLEQKLMENFNKLDEPCIVVSTQVVEVSLDINFDVLFTECADIMSLIQRFGRVNRNRNDNSILKDIFIININNEKYKKSNYPYDFDIIEKTFNVFSKINNQCLEEKNIQFLIDSVHDTSSSDKFDLCSPWNDKKEWKNTLYSNVISTLISKELNFESYIGILEKDYKEYYETRNKDLEIPLSYEPKNYNKLMYGDKVIAYIFPDKNYDNEVGLNI